MIHLVEGEDAFLRAEAVASAFLEGDDVRPHDGASTLAAVLDDARNGSWIGRPVVHVRGAGPFVAENAEALAKVAAELIVLVLEAEKFDKRRKGMKALIKVSRHVECDPPGDERGLLAFVRRRGAHHGARFLEGADALLVRRLGGHGLSCSALDAEVSKLAAAGPEVRPGDVEALVAQSTSFTNFALVDAVGAGDAPRALGLLGAILRDGSVGRDGARERDPRALAPMLLGALRWDLMARARREPMTPEAHEHLRRRHAGLREADLALKTGADPRATLTVLVTRLAR